MTNLRSSLIWAAAFVLLALANRFGLIADKDATTMFAILPAVWVASGGLGRCRLRKVTA
ncbi:MAG: hypothetical protein QFC78_09100 [Pseudomonadota bacterium]|nr:hypothetical protein [Pseudomonadota bacterium]